MIPHSGLTRVLRLVPGIRRSPRGQDSRSSRPPISSARGLKIDRFPGPKRSQDTMLNQALKDLVTARILPNVQTPAQYLGGELHSVPQGPSNLPGERLHRLPRHLRDGDEPPRPPGALQHHERGQLGRRAAPLPHFPTSRPPFEATRSRSTVWRRSRRSISSMCLASRFNTKLATRTS